ncbi:Phosphoribosylglycinamide formyltransferase [Anaerohalosphaera lusitana]|uniref:phosphoribosylglycinamide formyltransferase 1 n=1 Tax=Anaerohalosphaera lusitana TaxID=1936003 RepID=A0A1U9NIJ9_9BACT|nr:formyltransferase family protein [Anaerohalosphaera lusitana]AQT67554.1 Phosphoribosylglycinamide formyltransferase [Anaerohalosphaera lusitana]
MSNQITIYTDGGSRGNPGPGGSGYALYDSEGNLILGRGVYLGKTTNNVAEYTGMLEALRTASEMNFENVQVFTDSELMTKQLNGIYKVKSPNLKSIYKQCVELLDSFASWEVSHVYRENNKEADALANQAMDARADVEIEGDVPAEPKGKKLRLGVLISGGGRTMENIDKQIKAGKLNAEIAVAVCSRAKIKGVELTRKLGHKLEIVRKKDLPDLDAFSDRLVEIMDENRVDLIVQAGWLCLWKIPDKYDSRVMNIHPSLLPSFGGKGMWGNHVHQAVLDRGCKVSGCTVHFCTNEYDEGPIVIQRCCPAKPDDTPEKLASRVFAEECIAYPEAIRLFSEDRLSIRDGKVFIEEASASRKPRGQANLF